MKKKKNNISLFEDVEIKKSETEKEKDFLNEVFRTNRLWYDVDYLKFATSTINQPEHIGIALLYRNVRHLYDEYIENNLMESNEFRQILSVMIKNKILISKNNFEKTKQEIKQGFYQNELGEIAELVELESWDDDVWGGLF